MFLKSFLNRDEVQSGPDGEGILCNDAGMGAGHLATLGFAR